MNETKKTGCVVGRFQTPRLTPAHVDLIHFAKDNSDILLIIIGDSPTRCNTRHPLSFEIRKDMILAKYPTAEVIKLSDNASDVKWAQNLDVILDKYPNVTLYGGRDSFIPHYWGKHKTYVMAELPDISSTAIRAKLRTYDPRDNDQRFRQGVIHAIENKFPTVYPTVDIALIKHNEESEDEILFGRKHNSDIWCLMGGFVDPSDKSYMWAADRELHEEVSNLQNHELEYVGSYKIDDWRYRGTPDGIMTTLFMTYYMGGNPKGADDLAEVKWFKLSEALEVVGEHHKRLVKEALNTIQSKVTFY